MDKTFSKLRHVWVGFCCVLCWKCWIDYMAKMQIRKFQLILEEFQFSFTRYIYQNTMLNSFNPPSRSSLTIFCWAICPCINSLSICFVLFWSSFSSWLWHTPISDHSVMWIYKPKKIISAEINYFLVLKLVFRMWVEINISGSTHCNDACSKIQLSVLFSYSQ